MFWHATSLSILLSALAPRQAPVWVWRGAAPRSGVVEVDLVRGSIRVERIEGGRVELVARRSGHGDDPRTVRLDLNQTEGRLVLRALYPARRLPGPGALPVNPETGRVECLPEDSRGDFWYSDVRVDLIVRVPSRVRVRAGLLEGDVSAPPGLLVTPSAVPSGH